ncbi:restriction endonuclease subunit S [Streptomyces sp. NPDC001034]|uniref:restriction endonuclease subunit S n=1 Tax=Streptomyces sp. NPDC001034 TaxID=3154375 RepID=UPI00333008A3
MSVDGERELPAGWAWTALGELVEVLDNLRVPISANERSKRPGNVPYYGAAGQVGWIDEALFDEDLILLGEDGVQFFDRRKIKAYRISGKSWVNNHAHVLRAIPEMADWRYVCHYLNAFNYEGYANGTTRLKLTKSAMLSIPVALPPLAEQYRIVEVLEEQLSRLEVALGSLRSSAVRSAGLRRSLAAKAFSGTLLSDSGSSPLLAQPLLERVDAQVSAHAGKKRWSQERTPAQEWCHDLPEGWEWRTLGSLSLMIQYGTSAKAETSAADDAVPVIRMGNIQSGSIVLNDIKYLPGDHPDIDPMRLQGGDLLFNRTNSAELVGKSAVYRDDLGEAVFASYLIRCRLADGIDPDWVSTYVNSVGGRKYIRSVLSQQVGQANVNSVKLAMFPIPVPPAEEQVKIMKNLRDWYRLLEYSDKSRETAKLRAVQLRESLLRAAFSGRLTQQSPEDEPAADLLARIAAERAAQDPPKRAGKISRRRAATSSALRGAVATGPAPEPTPVPVLAVQQEFDL